MATETHPATALDVPVLPVEDVIRMVERMTPPDRLRVLAAASRLVREDVVVQTATAVRAKNPHSDDDDEAAWQAERARILANVPPESSAHRLLGAFRGKGPIAMTPDEERAIVEEALMEKYGR